MARRCQLRDRQPRFHAVRVNVKSSGRALLILFLFSDVGELDAPPGSGQGRTAPSQGSCCRLEKADLRLQNWLRTASLRLPTARNCWPPDQPGRFIFAIHCWSILQPNLVVQTSCNGPTAAAAER